MSEGARIAKTFYEAFGRLDAITMNSLYAEGATFSDTVFPGLDTRETKGMWDMLSKSARNFRLTFEVKDASETHANVDWVAHYTFSRTGRPVANHVSTHMQIRDGRIIAQNDVFDFHTWARQAFGPLGLLVGWLPSFRKKVQATAREGLMNHLAKG